MKEIKKIYIASFLYGFTNLSAVVFTLYFLSNGLSQTQIALLFSIFMISLALLEIPTGAISDLFGHKTSIFWGIIIESLYFLIFALSRNFFFFAIGMLVAALGIALQSGAISSLIYEILKKNKLEESFEKVIGRKFALVIMGGLIASPIGAYIFKYYHSVPYILTFIILLISSFFYLSVKHNPKSSEFSPSNYIKQIKTGFGLMVRNKKLMGLTLIGFALTMGRLVYGQNINQPYLLNIGVPVEYIGIVAAIGGIMLLLVSSNTHKITKFLGERKAILVMFILPFITYVALSYINDISAIIFIVIYYISVAYRMPAMISIAQKEVHPKYRATMSSTSSFLSSVIVGSILPIWGSLIDYSSINTTLLVLGICILLIGIIGFVIIKSHKKRVIVV